MDATQSLQAAVVEGLYAEAEAVDPGGEIAGEGPVFDGAGVGLEGDLGTRREAQARAGQLQETIDARRREQRRRAAAEEHAVDGAAPREGQVEVEIGDQRIDV